MNSTTEFDGLEFEPVEVIAEAPAPSPKKKGGRPPKYANDEERKAARRARDRERRARNKGEAPKGDGGNPDQLDLEAEAARIAQEFAAAGPSAMPAPDADPAAGATDPKPQGAEPTGAADEGPAPTTPPAAQWVTGYILLALMDAVNPMIVGFLLRRKGLKLPDPSAVQFTREEREGLMPLADQAAAHMLSSVPPWALFLAVSTTMAYTKATLAAVPMEDKKRA